MPAVLDASGLSIQTQAEIQAELEDAIRAETGIETLVFTGDTALGQLVGALSLREFALHELLQGLYDSARLDAAGNVQLSGLVPVGGMTRKPATRSTVTATYVGTAATVVAAGTVFEVTGTSDRFYSTAAATIAAPGARAALTAYALGVRRTNGGNVYQVTTAGTTDAGAGPTTTGAAIADGTVVWRYLGTGTGVVDVACEAQATGPIPAPADSLVTIVTAVAGLTSVLNLAAAEPGSDVETDDELRVRYAESFHLPGSATIDAIRADVLAIEGVTECVVYQNETKIVGANGIPGMPGTSVFVLVDGTATAQEIGDVLWGTVAAGIETWGAAAPNPVAVTVTDASGGLHTVYYSTPTDRTVDVQIAISGGLVAIPMAEIVAAVSAYIASLGIGDDVVLWRVSSIIGETARLYGYEPTGLLVQLQKAGGGFAAANAAIDYYERAAFGAVTWV